MIEYGLGEDGKGEDDKDKLVGDNEELGEVTVEKFGGVRVEFASFHQHVLYAPLKLLLMILQLLVSVVELWIVKVIENADHGCSMEDEQLQVGVRMRM